MDNRSLARKLHPTLIQPALRVLKLGKMDNLDVAIKPFDANDDEKAEKVSFLIRENGKPVKSGKPTEALKGIVKRVCDHSTLAISRREVTLSLKAEKPADNGSEGDNDGDGEANTEGGE